MKLSEFDFDLPENLIATRPAVPRSSARLLTALSGAIGDRYVYELPDILYPGDLLVLNDTKVIPARLSGTRRRATGQGNAIARIEITLLEPTADGWQALAKPLRKLRVGETIVFSDALSADVTQIAESRLHLTFDAQGDAFDAELAKIGAMPLPPYIAALRPPDARDADDYQSVWAQRSGAVAAPTASLHFDQVLLDALAARGVEFAHVTLHVGAGTFLPVKIEDVTRHRMHSEWGEVSGAAAEAINRAKQEGRRVIPVGTTALRLIESAAVERGRVAAFDGTTGIFIYPGYQFRVSDGLMTNFHLPKSTLLMLVSALLGRNKIMEIYAHAVAERYRFFSYGDASLLIP